MQELLVVRMVFKKIFSRRPFAKKPVNLPPKAKEPEYMKFIRVNLSYQAKYFPDLVKIHNRFISKPSFYRGKKVPIITGSLHVDVKLVKNMRKMLLLEKRINDVRVRATKIKNLEQAKEMVDKARKLEAQFNDLKQVNFNIYLEFFKTKAGSSDSTPAK